MELLIRAHENLLLFNYWFYVPCLLIIILIIFFIKAVFLLEKIEKNTRQNKESGK